MEIIILGSGTCMPSLNRAPAAYYLNIKHEEILVDCGAETLVQLEKAKKSYKDIDKIFLTHFHPDHFIGLIPFLQALNWTPGFVRTKDLVIIGPKGFKKFYNNITSLLRGITPRGYKVVLKEITNKIQFKDYLVECADTIHSDPSVAYKFTEDEKSVVFSGDADYDKELVKLSSEADLLILECSFTNNDKVNKHLIPKECGLIAKESNAKSLLLTHIYVSSSDSQRLKEAKEIFKKTKLAKDLMRIKL